jgi:DNA-binding NarL/FixJ family response regulator
VARALRVLLAEDDDDFAECVRTAFADDGRVEVIARARNGDRAVELAAEHHPDVVLMDLQMPVCGGLEATRMIHELDPQQHVVIYTGSGSFVDAMRAEVAGAVGYLHKEALTAPDVAEALLVLHRNYERALLERELD